MLRKYPPEKCPEEFKKIREAYEILIDPILKAEYNAFINHKDNINEYRKKGNNALDKKQYRRADRKSTRLNSSHANISYAVFCLKKQISLLTSFYITESLTYIILDSSHICTATVACILPFL